MNRILATVVVLLAIAAVTLVAVTASPDTVPGTAVAVPAERLHGTSAAVATARDDALAAASTDIAVLTSFDYRSVDTVLDGWEKLLTGSALESVRGNRETVRQQVTQSRVVSTGAVLDAAVSDVDESGGKVVVLAAVKVTTTVADAPQTIKLLRLRMLMVREDGEWKVAAYDQVATEN